MPKIKGPCIIEVPKNGILEFDNLVMKGCKLRCFSHNIKYELIKYIKMNTMDHIKFGKQSNIPNYCIYWFISIWRVWDYLGTKSSIVEKYKLSYSKDNINIEYVRCPICKFLNKKIKIKKCKYKNNS